MPKKSTSSSRIPKERNDGAEVGYYVYANGSSAWGCGLYRNGEKPLRIDADNAKEIHKSSEEDKVSWYKSRQVKIAEESASKKK
jgi:hypothetical protein